MHQCAIISFHHELEQLAEKHVTLCRMHSACPGLLQATKPSAKLARGQNDSKCPTKVTKISFKTLVYFSDEPHLVETSLEMAHETIETHVLLEPGGFPLPDASQMGKIWKDHRPLDLLE